MSSALSDCFRSHKASIKNDPPPHNDSVSSCLLVANPTVTLNHSHAIPLLPLSFAVALLVLSLSVYMEALQYNSFVNGFHMDDVVAIQKNKDVINPGEFDWIGFLRHDFWGLDMFSGEWTHKSFRPLTTLSYRINWLLNGIDTSAFHCTNVLLHVLSSILVVIASRQVLRFSVSDSYVAGALFGVHPVHTESLLYLVGRADILCTVFMLGALVVYKKNIGIGVDMLSYLLVVLAGLSKELGFMVFPVMLTINLLGSRSTFEFGRFLTTLIVACMCLWLRHWYTDGTYLKMSPQDNPVSFEDDDMGRRLSYMLIHGEYFRLLLFPLFLCYDYSLNTIPLVCDWSDVRLLSPAASYLGLSAVILWSLRRCHIGSLVSLSFFVFSAIPMSNILFPIGTVVGERLLYIPSIAFVWLSVIAAKSLPSRIGRWGIVIIFAMWGTRCLFRVDDWKTANNLTLVDGYRNPRSAKTQYNLAVQYFTKQKYPEAAEAFRRSYETDEQQRDGIAYWRAGQVELLRGNVSAAEKLLTAATTKYGAKLMVREEEIFHDAGLACYHNGHLEEARYYLSAALTLNPRFPKALSNMACFLTSTGDIGTAISLARQATELKPKNVIYSGNVWILASKIGDESLIRWAQNRTLTIQPSFIPNPHCIWEFKPAEGGPGDSALND